MGGGAWPFLVGGAIYLVNLRKDHCRTQETERPENDETSLSVGRFLIVPADFVVMRSSMPKTSVLVGSYA
ncbi:hypothetical protein YC2023_066067 [Brassica napus]